VECEVSSGMCGCGWHNVDDATSTRRTYADASDASCGDVGLHDLGKFGSTFGGAHGSVQEATELHCWAR
jgi:hypothetical protein